MIPGSRTIAAQFLGAFLCLFPAIHALAQDGAGAKSPNPDGPRPRPGLTDRQSADAVELARGAMTALRERTEGQAARDKEKAADRREYIIGVEFQESTGSSSPPGEERGVSATETKPPAGDPIRPATAKPGPRAVVTSYRYLDDVTVFTVVDLGTRRVVDVQAARHLRTPLSDAEFEEAKALARERSDEVKELYDRFGARIGVYPQFSQFVASKDDPRIHRAVHLTYRIGTKDLSHPRPIVDLTTRTVTTPPPGGSAGPR